MIYKWFKSMGNKFMEYISDDFQKIKSSFEVGITRSGLAFDEDIFSDTIIKCNNKLDKENLTKNQMIYYFWMAFKNNTLRELGYLRNNTTDEIPEDIIDDEPYEKENDKFEKVSQLIIDKFGEELYQLFSLHANGTTYEDLYKITKQENLKYIFRRIREYVRNNINED